MSQNDLTLADQTFPEMLLDLNSAFQALGSLSSGAAAPPVTYPFQLWADTTTDLIQMRNKANTAWVTLAKIDVATNQWDLRAQVLQALTAAGFTFKNAAGTVLATLSDAGVLSGLNVTIGAGKTLTVSAGTLALADDQIDGGKVRAATTLLRGTVDLTQTVLAGLIGTFAMTTPPTGWLKANGAAVSRTTYAGLFAAVGTAFGAGNGSTTFNVPDLRGEFLRGWDDGRGVDAGRGFGSAQGDAIRNITGTHNGLQYPDTMTGAFYDGGTSANKAPGLDAGGKMVGFNAALVVPTAAENRPRNIALLTCIKY